MSTSAIRANPVLTRDMITTTFGQSILRVTSQRTRHGSTIFNRISAAVFALGFNERTCWAMAINWQTGSEEESTPRSAHRVAQSFCPRRPTLDYTRQAPLGSYSRRG